MLMGQQSGHSEAGRHQHGIKNKKKQKEKKHLSKPLKVDLCSGKTFCELCQTQIHR